MEESTTETQRWKGWPIYMYQEANTYLRSRGFFLIRPVFAAFVH